MFVTELHSVPFMKENKNLHPQISRPDPENSLAMRIAVLSNLVARPFFTLHGKQRNLTLAEWRLFQLLHAHPGLSLTAVCERTGMHKMQVSRSVQRSVRLGRVHWLPDPSDGRKKLLYLTEQGVQLCEAMYPDTARRESELVAGLSDSQQRQLGKLLSQLIDYMRSRQD